MGKYGEVVEKIHVVRIRRIAKTLCTHARGVYVAARVAHGRCGDRRTICNYKNAGGATSVPTAQLEVFLRLATSMSLVVSAFRFLVLPPGDRTPFTLSEARYFLFPAVLLVVLAGFARRPGTWVLRLALLPVALTAILRGVFGFAILDPDEEPVNHMFGSVVYSAKNDRTFTFS